MMSILLSALTGAFIVLLATAFYLPSRIAMDRRFDTTCGTLAYFDEIYQHMRLLQTCFRNRFSENKSAVRLAQFNEHRQKIEGPLKSSMLHTKISMVYGPESEQLHKFIFLRHRLMEITATMLRATPDTWKVIDKSVNKQFSEVLDPTRTQISQLFTESVSLPHTLASMFKVKFGFPFRFRSSKEAYT